MKSSKKRETYLFDIFIAIKKIKKVISFYQNIDELLRDFTSWDSLLRELDIIAIASEKLNANDYIRKESQVIIYLSKRVKGQYYSIDKNLIWKIVNQNIDMFEDEIIRVINTIEKSYRDELIDMFRDDNWHLDFIVDALNTLKR